MATLNTIDTRLAKQLQEACALRGVSIVGVAGGWSVLMKVGMSEKPLGAQRTGRVRTWRSLDTVMEYLRKDLGIVKVDGVDASGHNPASIHKARPDVAGRMRQAHRAVTDLKGLVPAPAEPVSVESMTLAGHLVKMPNVGRDEDFERV